MSPLVLDNLNKIRFCLEKAAARGGRDASAVTLVAVTKYANLSQLRELLASGLVQDVGENKVQDAAAKQQALGELARRARWRMIGHLQGNKARLAVRHFSSVDSLDSLKLARLLDEALAQEGKSLPILAQVKLTGKAAQSGVAPGELGEFLKGLEVFPRLEVHGLMGIAPMDGPPEAARPYFRELKKLFDRFFADREKARLSMGMSRDFEIAVEEGSTMIRIGSSIFGATT